MLERCRRGPATSPCSWWAGHRGRCWPPEVLQGVGVAILVLVAGAAACLPAGRRDVVAVLGDPLSRLVMLVLGLEIVVLAWGRALRRALGEVWAG